MKRSKRPIPKLPADLDPHRNGHGGDLPKMEHKKMPTCTILVGVPASGKSTWIEENFSHIDGDWYTRINDRTRFSILSSDDVITRIAARHRMTYDEAFKDLIGFADKYFWKMIDYRGGLEANIIIDRMNLSPKSRKKIIDRLPGYRFEAIIFDTPEEQEWKRRLAARPGKTIPQDVLNSMVNSFTRPTFDEGFSVIIGSYGAHLPVA